MSSRKNRYPYQAALIFGVPGAGKGTQGDILTVVPGFYHLSSGVIFRKLDPQSPDGRIIREYSARGELVPDEVTVRVFLNWLEAQRAARRYQPSEELLLLDGIPRNVNQCEMLQKYIDVKLLLHFVCHDEEAMIERIRRRAALENRVDDADESVTRRRFEVYHRETQPVLDFYSEGVVREIDSMQRPAAVLRDCLKSLVPVIEDCYPVD